MKQQYILLFFFLTITPFCFSQYDWTEGEIVLKSGESVKGLVKIPIISKNFVSFNGKSKVKLKDRATGKKTKFEEHQIKLIKFEYSDSKIAIYEYVAVSKTKKEIFCKLSNGNTILYGRIVGVSTSNPGGMSSFGLNEFYIKRSNEHIATPLITARPSTSFRKRAMKYFNDCPPLVKQLKERVLTKKDIIEVVEQYNNCL